MKSKLQIRNSVIEVICLLYILLFVYAGVSKLQDFETFQVQLGQSPLLSAYAMWISWMVILAEIAISFLLIFPPARKIGLWAGFNLMIMFTIYIFIILHYSSYVPCSCGGILEKMTWEVHLIFNIVFVILGAVAILLQQKNDAPQKKHFFKLPAVKILLISIFSSTAFIVVLFITSEKIMHYNNPFARRFIKSSIQFVTAKNLKFNSYYFAGYNGSEIYLGNSTAPLSMLSIDTTFKKFKNIRIDFKSDEIPFKAVKIYVKGKHFYLGDGTVPCMYRGNISDWKTNFEFKTVPSFTLAAPMDSASFVFRSNAGENGSNLIGIYNAKHDSEISYAQSLLRSQIDGIFDTDGMLQFDEQTKHIIYVYYYRNEFIIADQNADFVKAGHTIDTITKAKIKVAELKDGSQRKMAAPPLMVNAQMSINGNCLFIQSKIRGLYENDDTWKYGVVIDVYNIKENTYLHSIPIFASQYGKFKTFMVTDTHLYALFGSTLMVYKIQNLLKKEMNSILNQ